jgi:Fe-S-cluster containining protein
MIPEICQKCNNKLYGSIDCCTSPFVNYPGFLITLSDVNRIVKNTKFKINDFTKIIKVENDDLTKEEDNYFKDLGFNNNFLYMYGEGKCPFRRKKGCLIYDNRPLMCKLFPFWFKKNKNKDFEIIIEWGTNSKDENCLICKKYFKNKDISFLLSLIGETKESMMKNIIKFNKEIKLHKKLKHELNKKGLKRVINENFK